MEVIKSWFKMFPLVRFNEKSKKIKVPLNISDPSTVGLSWDLNNGLVQYSDGQN